MTPLYFNGRARAMAAAGSAALLTGLLTAPSLSLAQAATPTTTAANSDQIQEIVVTATRRPFKSARCWIGLSLGTRIASPRGAGD